MKLGQGFNDLSFCPKLSNEFGIIVVSLDEVGAAGSEAGGRLDEVGPQRALTEHDLVRVEVEVFDDLTMRQDQIYH